MAVVTLWMFSPTEGKSKYSYTLL